jgi:hypothetical protein
MTTTRKRAARFVAALALATTVAACGDNHANGGPADMTTTAAGNDMTTATCATNPMTPVELLNGCTTAQTGDPAKDAPYFPSLAPNGQLPPLP